MTVAVAVPLEAALAKRICGVSRRVVLRFAPELLPPVRYPNDHRGIEGFVRDPDSERRWRALIAGAEVLFGIPGDSAPGLASVIRSSSSLRWIQDTAAGAGEKVRAADLSPEELTRVTVTSASGIHAVPLAEFCLLGLLAFVKNLRRIEADQASRRWDHYAMDELRGRTLLIIGLGKIGREVARLASAFGMRVIGVNRAGATDCPHVQRACPAGALPELLPHADAVVLTLPLTDETRGLLDREAIGRIKPGATLINVGRGGVMDEGALVDALRGGQLGGAVLDVHATEPLSQDSPLWDLPNVLLTPHTAALSPLENERIVELFCGNLQRYLHGQPLLNRIDPQLLY